MNDVNYWNDIYKSKKDEKIIYDLWLDKFNNIIQKYKNKIILDFGCGSGNDTLYLKERDFLNIISCDYSEAALKIVQNTIKDAKTKCIDITEKLPFEDKSIDLIICDLSLHYFNEESTFKIISELKRILKDDGCIILRVNSINDINFGAGTGEKIENHFYLTKDGYKRFFDEDDLRYFFKDFNIEYLKEDNMNRYGSVKRTYEVVLNKNL